MTALSAWKSVDTDSLNEPRGRGPRFRNLKGNIRPMDSFPRLTEMGVLHPEEICRYSVNSVGYVDYLRIMYNRPKGSILPKTRTYEFPRVQKEIATKGETVMESSPELREALDELHNVVAARAQTEDSIAEILEEIHRLEESVSHHTASLHALIERLRTASK